MPTDLDAATAARKREAQAERMNRVGSSPAGWRFDQARADHTQDGGAPLPVVLNYSHGERRPHRSAEEGGGCLEPVA
jgi:hypothetical protein